ncbi:serine--tRNA ligase [Methanopyrus sp.]
MELEFSAEVELTLSREVDPGEIEPTVEEFVEEANEDLLQRGVPAGKEGAKIEDYRVLEDTIEMEITGTRYLRPHEAAMRVRKRLAERLGREHRVGVRDLKVTRYEVVLRFDREVTRDDVGYVPVADDVVVEDGTVRLTFKDVDEEMLRRHVIDRVIRLVAWAVEEGSELVERVTEVEPGTVVDESGPREIRFEGDVTEEARRRGWVREFPGRGQWIYTPPMAALFEALRDFLLERVTRKLGFEPALFPKLIPLETMFRMRYLHGLPDGMYYVCPPKRDPELFDDFKRELYAWGELNERTLGSLKEKLRDPGYVLAPAQCEPFYELLRGEVVDPERLPIKLYDCSGWTYRWEGGAAKGLERVNEFQRIEHVWIAEPEEAEGIREELLEATKRAADELELEWKVVVSDDPFYLEGRLLEDRDIELPDVPSYEFEVYLPFKGERSSEEAWISVGSFNVHGEHFVDGFNVREKSGGTLFTGCAGLGVTRWVVGVLAQYGFEPEEWPEPILERIDEKFGGLPEVPKTLTWPE